MSPERLLAATKVLSETTLPSRSNRAGANRPKTRAPETSANHPLSPWSAPARKETANHNRRSSRAMRRRLLLVLAAIAVLPGGPAAAEAGDSKKKTGGE